MSRIVLLATAAPPRLALESAVPALRARGTRVDVLVTRDLAEGFVGLDVGRYHRLSLPRPARGGPSRPGRRLREVARLRRLQALQRFSGWPLRAWRLVREDPVAHEVVDGADAVVALDLLSAYAARRLHRRFGVPAWLGLSAAVDAAQHGRLR